VSLRTLPSHPSLKSLKNQAKQFLRAHKAGKEEAYRRLLESHPRCLNLSLEAVKEIPCSHADALLVLAREYGFSSWVQLTEALEHPPSSLSADQDPFTNEPGWQWIMAPNLNHSLGTSGATGGEGCKVLYENKTTSDALSVHIAIGPELIIREWRLIALEAEGRRHILQEHGSTSSGFEFALLGYRLPYNEVPHGVIQYLGIEAAL
jgi:hypothetical protein